MNYEAGLAALEARVGPTDSDEWRDLSLFKARLLENLRNSRRLGDTPIFAADRAQIIDQLNGLALRLANRSFVDLCLGTSRGGAGAGEEPGSGAGGAGVRPEGGHVGPTASPSLDVDPLVDILARQAANAPAGPNWYFRDLIDRAGLRDRQRQSLAGVWTGDANVDARRLVRWAHAQGTDATEGADRRYTTLGSIMAALLNDVGLEDASAIVPILIVHRLVRNRPVADRLAMRYQLPVAPPADAAAASVPDIRSPGPLDEVELQSWLRPEPDFQDVGFLKRAIERAASVCRVELAGVNRRGTGFLVGDDLVLTNYHVLRWDAGESIEQNAGATLLRFGAFTSAQATESEGRTFALAGDTPIVASSPTDELDFALLRVEDAILSAGDLRPCAFSLTRPQQGTSLNILQHPGGAAMKLALSGNGVTAVYPDSGLIRYATRSASGSSGAPCFDDDWKVVALHRAERATVFGRIREGILFGAIHDRIKGHL
jgi:hypothetical protein